MPKKNKYRDSEADFINRTPIMYRRSVIKVFRDYSLKSNNNEMGRPERIIEEFASILKEDINKVYLQYYEKVQNIRKGVNAVLNQEGLFHLVEQFVWKYCEDKMLTLNTSIHLSKFAKYTSHFFENSSDDFRGEKKHTRLEDRKYELECCSTGSYYIAEFSPNPAWNSTNEAIKKLSDESIRSIKKNFYIAIKNLNNNIYNLAFAFNNDPEEEIFYGIFLKKSRRIIMKNLNSSEPLFIELLYEERNTYSVISLPHLAFLTHRIGRTVFESDFNTALLVQNITKIKKNNEAKMIDLKFKEILNLIDMNS